MTQYASLSTRASLDTANPSTDRPPGTLSVARDLNHRYWGPRQGSIAVDHPRDHSHTPCGPGYPYYRDGTAGNALTEFAHPDQRDLTKQWTFDLSFRPTDLTHTAKDFVQLFEWRLSSSLTALRVLLKGPGSGADEGKIRAEITPTSAADSAGTTVTLDGTTALSVGTDPQDKHCIRVVRDRGTVTLYVDGASEDSDSISAAQHHQGSSEIGSWGFTNDTTTASIDYFKGEFFHAQMRRGVHTTGHTLMQACHPLARGVVLHATSGGVLFPEDHSRYRSGNNSNGSFSSSIGSTQNEYPHLCPAQGLQTFTDLSGRTWNMIYVGGYFYSLEVL